MSARGPGRLDVAGIGSMVVDRVHRAPRILGGDEKAILRPLAAGGPVAIHAGGVVLNHLGWAAVLGLRAGIFGRQADDENGRFLRAAMDRLGIERDLVLEGSATSVAEIFVDDTIDDSVCECAREKQSGIGRADNTGERAQLFGQPRRPPHHGVGLRPHPYREHALDLPELLQDPIGLDPGIR